MCQASSWLSGTGALNLTSTWMDWSQLQSLVGLVRQLDPSWISISLTTIKFLFFAALGLGVITSRPRDGVTRVGLGRHVPGKRFEKGYWHGSPVWLPCRLRKATRRFRRYNWPLTSVNIYIVRGHGHKRRQIISRPHITCIWNTTSRVRVLEIHCQ